MRKIYIIKDTHRDLLPLAKEADEVMEREEFREYVSVHGYHFTCALADYASKMLENADGTSHHWTTQQVHDAIKETDEMYSKGDVAYVANLLYSDFYPNPIKTEEGVLEATKRIIHDADGYEGMVFMRWLSDVIGKHLAVDWLKFM